MLRIVEIVSLFLLLDFWQYLLELEAVLFHSTALGFSWLHRSWNLTNSIAINRAVQCNNTITKYVQKYEIVDYQYWQKHKYY